MAKVSGPLHSDSASGKFAKSMVFASWKGIPTVRQLVTPANPRSITQVAVRVMMSYLSKVWNGIASQDKATWNAIAESRNISAFNAFIGECLSRWQINKAPTRAYPAAESVSNLNIDSVEGGGVLLSAVAGDGFITVGSTPDTLDAFGAVGVALFRGAAAPTPMSWANCIGVFPVSPGVAWSMVDAPLSPGTYHYKAALFSSSGGFGALSAADVNATVL